MWSPRVSFLHLYEGTALAIAPQSWALWGSMVCVKTDTESVSLAPGSREDPLSDVTAGVLVRMFICFSQRRRYQSVDFKAWKTHQELPATDCKPIKHHLQMTLGLYGKANTSCDEVKTTKLIPACCDDRKINGRSSSTSWMPTVTEYKYMRSVS